MKIISTKEEILQAICDGSLFAGTVNILSTFEQKDYSEEEKALLQASALILEEKVKYGRDTNENDSTDKSY